MSALDSATAASPSVTPALDFARYDAIEEMADLAASLWRSIAEAAARGDRLTLEVHCKQVAAVTREAFATVKTLAAPEVVE
jgi:hypothetical protein